MTGFLLAAAIAAAALAIRSTRRPGPRPPVRGRARTHRPALPPGPAARPAADRVDPSGQAPLPAAVDGTSGSVTGARRRRYGRRGPSAPGERSGEQRPSQRPSAPGGGGGGVARFAALRRRLPGAAGRERAAKEAAVPEVLDVLRATVVAGAAPYRALLAAAETAPEVLASALDAAARAAAVGLGAGQALAAAGREHGLVELVVAGEALDLAESTGAPPAPVLAGVAAAATDRLRARQARAAATAQSRLAARVVSAMAPCFLLVLAATSPDDAAFLVRERMGWVTLAAATAFEAAGIWWAGRIVGGGP
ncbi:MAG TPA: hypothetical protein VF486_17585 [Actinomycetes bacterium]